LRWCAYGARKIALRNPERYVAVTALCPAVFPAEPADAAPADKRPLTVNDLNQAIGTNPETYSSNSAYDILRRNLAAHRSASPEIGLVVIVSWVRSHRVSVCNFTLC
jgi:S-formylglutathione hydrolase